MAGLLAMHGVNPVINMQHYPICEPCASVSESMPLCSSPSRNLEPRSLGSLFLLEDCDLSKELVIKVLEVRVMSTRIAAEKRVHTDLISKRARIVS